MFFPLFLVFFVFHHATRTVFLAYCFTTNRAEHNNRQHISPTIHNNEQHDTHDTALHTTAQPTTARNISTARPSTVVFLVIAAHLGYPSFQLLSCQLSMAGYWLETAGAKKPELGKTKTAHCSVCFLSPVNRGLEIDENSAVLVSDFCWIAWFSSVWREPRVPSTCWATGPKLSVFVR